MTTNVSTLNEPLRWGRMGYTFTATVVYYCVRTPSAASVEGFRKSITFKPRPTRERFHLLVHVGTQLWIALFAYLRRAAVSSRHLKRQTYARVSDGMLGESAIRPLFMIVLEKWDVYATTRSRPYSPSSQTLSSCFPPLEDH